MQRLGKVWLLTAWYSIHLPHVLTVPHELQVLASPDSSWARHSHAHQAMSRQPHHQEQDSIHPAVNVALWQS